MTGATVTFTASATGTSGSYEYQFYLRNPQGVWSLARAYSSTSSWTWNTASLPSGAYFVQVWARNAGTTVSYDTSTGKTYSLEIVPVSSSNVEPSVSGAIHTREPQS